MNENEHANREATEGKSKSQLHPAKQLRPWHYCLLAVPFVGLLWPPIYAKWTPEIFGIPFFYAYQFLWIFLSSGLTALVYRSITK